MNLSNMSYSELQSLMKILLTKLGQRCTLPAQCVTSEVVKDRILYIQENRTSLYRVMSDPH